MACGREVRPAIIALLALCLVASASAVVIDLGSYSVQDPKITVNYTEDVFLLSASLFNLDPAATVREYTLRQVPPKVPTQPTYQRTYYLYTGTQEDPQYLVSGSYQLTLEATDRQGHPTLDIVEFSITGMDIIMTQPPFGYSDTAPFDVVLETETDGDGTPASCQYSRQGWNVSTIRIDPVGTYVVTHRINDLAYTGSLYVSCFEREGRETRQRFAIGIDATPPIITALAIPPIVTNMADRSTIIRVRTDDNSTCTFDGDRFPLEDPSRLNSYRQTHELRSYYTEVTDTTRREFTHDIACTNLAGLEEEATITVIVHLGSTGNETQPPTGGSCIDDLDCNETEMCVNGMCVALNGTGCIDDFDCDVGETCVNGICTGGAGDTCSNGLLDIGEEDVDCGGDCPACMICFADEECDFGQVCGPNGVCIPSDGGSLPPRPITRDSDGDGIPDDLDDDDDNDGVLDIDDEAPYDPLIPKPTDWLAISLILIGLLIMGGTGWFLYQHDQQKRAATPQRPASPSAPAPSPRSSSPAYAQPSATQRAVQRTAPTQRSGPDRSTERKRILSAFGESKQPSPASRQPPQQPKKPVPKKQEEDDDEDVFEKLERIGKKK